MVTQLVLSILKRGLTRFRTLYVVAGKGENIQTCHRDNSRFRRCILSATTDTRGVH